MITKSLQNCRHVQTTFLIQRFLLFLTGRLLWRKRRRRTMENTKSSQSHRLLLRPLVCVSVPYFWSRSSHNGTVTFPVLTISGDDDYEDLTDGQRAVAIYDYQGGERATSFSDVYHSSVHIFPRPDPGIFFPPLRGWRWDLLQPWWSYHRDRDDWWGLVEGAVPRAGRPLPPGLRSAAAVRTMGQSLLKLKLVGFFHTKMLRSNYVIPLITLWSGSLAWNIYFF